MSQVLEKIKNLDPNNNEAVKETLTAFFQHIGKTANSTIWLRNLENVINRFPKYCMSHRNNIEIYLTKFLNCKTYSLVVDAAKCTHILQQVRPTQEKTATAKSSWREQMTLLCNTGHKLIDTVFANSVDIYRNGGYFQTADNTTLSVNSPMSAALFNATVLNNTETDEQVPQNKENALCTKLINILIFIQAMLVEIYPVGKPVRPQTILDLIVRILSVTSDVKSLNSIHDIIELKIQALRTLDALVTCLGSNLIPFSPLVFRMTIQSIRWSMECSIEDTRKVRCQAYNSLSIWLTTLHCHKPDSSRHDVKGKSLEDELITNIVKDITPQQHVVQLTMYSNPTKKLSKKAKRKFANTMLQESAIASHMPGEQKKNTESYSENDEVAISALECAEAFLTVCGIFLKPTSHKLLQERLIRECYLADRYSSERALCLCRALEVARKSVPPGVPPPTQYCLQLYSMLINSQHKAISKLCSQALLDIRLHLHCSPPSLNFNIEAPQEKRTNTHGDKNAISKKNRAALESLLDPDRIATLTNEIITINDEPKSKKSRLDEDVTDKISISSQSSVEINNITDEYNDDLDSDNDALVIHEMETQNIEVTSTDANNGKDDDDEQTDEVTSENKVTLNIHELETQIPINISNDTVEQEHSQHSLEVSYDYPNMCNKTVTVLEKMEDENLPSTNDTYDVQITCGQVIRNSQELSPKNKTDQVMEVVLEESNNIEKDSIDGVSEKKEEVVAQVNGVTEPSDVITESKLSVKITSENDVGITVEDMLADFVDEVIDENTNNV